MAKTNNYWKKWQELPLEERSKIVQIPSYSSHISREFFKRDSKLVAVDLLGKILTVRQPSALYHARIIEVAAYEGKTKSSADTVVYNPGTVGVSKKFGKNLLDISTGKRNDPSCVTLLAGVVVNGEAKYVEGPGNLCDALGIDLRYDGVFIDCSPDFWIGGESADIDKVSTRTVTSSRVPENCKGYFYFRP